MEKQDELRRSKNILPVLLQPNIVADRWGIGRKTIHRIIARGELRTVQIGARKLIHIDEILRAEKNGVGSRRRRV